MREGNDTDEREACWAKYWGWRRGIFHVGNQKSEMIRAGR